MTTREQDVQTVRDALLESRRIFIQEKYDIALRRLISSAIPAIDRLAAPEAPFITDRAAKEYLAIMEDTTVENWPGLQQIFDTKEHDGDCTQKPYTCSVCLANNAREAVRRILCALGKTPSDIHQSQDSQASLGANDHRCRPENGNAPLPCDTEKVKI